MTVTGVSSVHVDLLDATPPMSLILRILLFALQDQRINVKIRLSCYHQYIYFEKTIDDHVCLYLAHRHDITNIL